MRFEWDPRKGAANRRKHGVTFEEAESVFFDDEAKLYDDPDHSADEERYLLLGLSVGLRVLVVAHCVRQRDEFIRIISARRATRAEAEVYEGGEK
jgi:uncharacterized DUF497 family protein